MGGFGSKPEEELKKELNLVNFLDIIATKYILTENFQDLKNLTKPEYCNKLIILTAKVIKKFFKEKDIVYLAERVDDGIPYNRMSKENIIYLDTNAISPTSQRFSQREKKQFEKERQEHLQKQLYKQHKARKADAARTVVDHQTYRYPPTRAQLEDPRRYKGGGLEDLLKGFFEGNKDSEKKKKKKKYRTIPPPKKTLLSELDIRNPVQKDRMCKGIAKFYIKIAHVFAAIAKTINPRYVFTDSQGNVKNYSIWNKKRIPPGAVPRFVEDSLCSRRINALEPIESENTVSINLSKVCNLNKRMKTLTQENYPDHFTEHGKKKIFLRTLGDEKGIPALEELYNDKYNYITGKFTGRKSGGKGELQYEQDLKEFYEAFTGSSETDKISYSQWNKSGNKKFADVPLAPYHENKLCIGDNAKWKKKYSGSSGLFTEYANHIKKMFQNAHQNQKELLAILQKIFVYIEAPNIERTKILTLNPKLTFTELDTLVDTSRKTIVKMYIECQKNFQIGLNIFEGIIMERNIQNAVNQNKSLKQEGDKVIAIEPDQNLRSNIQKTLVARVAN